MCLQVPASVSLSAKLRSSIHYAVTETVFTLVIPAWLFLGFMEEVIDSMAGQVPLRYVHRMHGAHGLGCLRQQLG